MNISINWTVFITLLALLFVPSLVLFNYSTKQTRTTVLIGVFIYLCVIIWFFQDKLFNVNTEIFYVGGNANTTNNNRSRCRAAANLTNQRRNGNGNRISRNGNNRRFGRNIGGNIGGSNNIRNVNKI